MTLTPPLLTIPNHHNDPFTINEDEYRFIAYAPNIYGEQMIFAIKRDETQPYLYHGDCGWKPEKVIEGRCSMIVLSLEEQMWLMACWALSYWIREPMEKK